MSGSGVKCKPRTREHLLLAAILLVSSGLNCLRLQQVGVNGFGNPYYAAGVQTMLTSWRHFFFLAFDPAGFLSMDKAPLALWIQAASARLFGFHGLSLLLPQALAGVLSVYVMYRLVRRSHSALASLLAAFCLAVMPISVVVSRTNFPDAWLILTLLLTAWAIDLSVERRSLRWLTLAGVLAGVAFNVKTLQMALVVPALMALYLFGATLPWRKRLWHGGLAVLVALLVALPWVLAVELTPASQRPYVGGSRSNSVLELIVGYNGFARLWGEDFSFFLGPPGPLRLFNNELAGQASWLLPFAIMGACLALREARRDATFPSPSQRSLILWVMWLAPQLVYFSVSQFWHRYYLATMAPAIAALVGIGAEAVLSAWQRARRCWGWGSVLLLGCGLVQVAILLRFPQWGRVLVPVLLLLFAAASLAALRGLARQAFIAGILLLHIVPAVWAAIPVVTCAHMTLPVAGPQPTACRPFEVKPFLDGDLVAYLEQQRNGATFMAATFDLGIAEMGILETGEPFMALGGYRGRDPILTVDEFAQLVANREVRTFLSLEEPGEEWEEQRPILQWVVGHCPLSSMELEGILVRGPCSAEA